MNITQDEQFQNEYLRPSIKHNNDFLLLLINNYLTSSKIKLSFENLEIARNQIEDILKKDIVLKNNVIGAVISHIENSELEYYFENKSKCNTRIINIVAKRCFDELLKLVPVQ